MAAFQPQAEAFVKKGYVAALAEHQVFCRDKTTPADALMDALSAHDWLHTHALKLNINPRRILLSGGSSDGHLALAAAMLERADQKPAASVLFNPAVDLVPPRGSARRSP